MLPDVLLSLINTTPQQFENGVFTLKTHQMFSVHTSPEEFKNATITDHFGFVFEENSVKQTTLFFFFLTLIYLLTIQSITLPYIQYKYTIVNSNNS